jgi:hypothetical protein
MNHSEDYLELLEVTIMPEEYCFVYGDDNKNVCISCRSSTPDDVTAAFVSYMRALSFSEKDIKNALTKKAHLIEIPL